MVYRENRGRGRSGTAEDRGRPGAASSLKSVRSLIKNDNIPAIENSLVACFISKNNIRTRNRFINGILRSTTQKDADHVEAWLAKNNIDLTLSNLGRMFELLVPREDKKLNGEFYTPKFIIDYIVKKTIKPHTRTVCDCSCGGGAFLLESARRISKIHGIKISKVIEKYIYGTDIIRANIRRTKIILTLLMLMNKEDKRHLSFNLKSMDSLNTDWHRAFPDVIRARGGGV